MIQECPGGVSAPKEFFSAGIHAGVKKVKKDLALVYTSRPAAAAGVFTTNKVPAAPVLVDRQQLVRSKTFRAIVVNSGNANALTGPRGLEDVSAIRNGVAQALGIADELASCHTAIIGDLVIEAPAFLLDFLQTRLVGRDSLFQPDENIGEFFHVNLQNQSMLAL